MFSKKDFFKSEYYQHLFLVKILTKYIVSCICQFSFLLCSIVVFRSFGFGCILQLLGATTRHSKCNKHQKYTIVIIVAKFVIMAFLCNC